MTSANKFDQKQKFETGVNCPGSIVRVKSICYFNQNPKIG